MGYRLGVDLGTTFTAAAVDRGPGPTMLGLGNRALQVPSVLFLTEDDTFLVGEAAEHRGVSQPDRVVREFKRRVGDTVPILVAGRPFSPQALTARLLEFVVATATEREGEAPDEVVLTYPANWGGYKRELFSQVASLANLPHAMTCTEPEAAATQYASRARLAPGARLAVYDLGGGTFDVCVLEKQADGFRVLGAPDGVEHLGGIDFDEAVFRHVMAGLGDEVSGLDASDPMVTAGLSRMRRDCVEAKEALSADVDTVIPVNLPGLSTMVRLTRAELESLITPALRETLAATGRALRSASVSADQLSAVVLVGGSSRIPLVSHLLQSEFGVPTTRDTHPKHDIALGAARWDVAGHAPVAPLPAATVLPAVTDWPTRGPDQEELPTPPPPAPPPRQVDPSAPEPADPPPPEPPTPAPEPPTPPPSSAPAGAPSPQEPPSLQAHPSTSSLPGISRPAVLGAAALVVVALVIGAIVLTRGGDEDSGSTATGGSPSQTGASSGGIETPTSSPGAPLFGEHEILLPRVDPASPEAGFDLWTIPDGTSAEGAAAPFRVLAGSEDLPSVSRDRTLLQFRQRPVEGSNDDWTMMVLTGPDAEPVPFFTTPPGDEKVCMGRVGWAPDGGAVALICATNDVGTLYTVPVDEDGRADGAQLQAVGLAGLGLSHVSVTADGRYVVVAFGSPQGQRTGIWRVPFGGGRAEQLTSNIVTSAVSAPRGDDVVFIRDGDLYLVDPNGDTACGDATPDPVTGLRVCRLTATPEYDHHPAWSPDAGLVAFLRNVDGNADSPSRLMLLNLADPADPTALTSDPALQGALAWASR